jgi:hypothetical protein
MTPHAIGTAGTADTIDAIGTNTTTNASTNTIDALPSINRL